MSPGSLVSRAVRPSSSPFFGQVLRIKRVISGKVNGWMTASVVDTPSIRINRVLRGNAIAWLTNAQRERLKSNEGIQGRLDKLHDSCVASREISVVRLINYDRCENCLADVSFCGFTRRRNGAGF